MLYVSDLYGFLWVLYYRFVDFRSLVGNEKDDTGVSYGLDFAFASVNGYRFGALDIYREFICLLFRFCVICCVKGPLFYRRVFRGV